MTAQKWYIVKTQGGNCQIIEIGGEKTPGAEEFWGPFASPEEAIARRVGLIRAGKCQPV